MIRCQICKKLFRQITWAHLKYMHGIIVGEYKKKYKPKHLQCKSMRRKQSENNIGNDYGIGNKSRTGLFGHKCTEENKERQRRLMIKMRADGTITSEMGGVCEWYPIMNYTLGKDVKVQGKLEVRFAELLNKLRIRWWRPKPKTYMLNKKEHKYFCDFWLPDERLYVEIKGWVRKEDKKAVREKKRMMIKRGKKKGHTYKMMFRKDIRDFELNVADVVW